jgi:hypothetical protein
MTPQPIESRVENLEDRVTRLEELPGRVDRLELHIVQLRSEMHAEFSDVRAEIRAGDQKKAQRPRLSRSEPRRSDPRIGSAPARLKIRIDVR